MGAGGDRADAGAAAAVRDAERLVQVQVRHVRAEPARPGQPDQRVQVRAVHVDLAARLVDRLADLGHGLLEHPVGGRVGQHDRGDLPAPVLQLGLQVTQVDRAVAAALDHHDPQARQHRAGRVGPVRRLGDQADVPAGVAAGAVVAPDGQQARQLALRPGVGLHGHRVVAGDLGQPPFQVADQLGVPGGLRRRREGVQVGELRPAHRLHLGGRVQLHRARAERDHRAVQRDVEVGEAAEVAQHGRLAPVLVEDRVARGTPSSGPGRPGAPGRTRPAGRGPWPRPARRPAARPPPAPRRRWSSRRRRCRPCRRRPGAGCSRLPWPGPRPRRPRRAGGPGSCRRSPRPVRPGRCPAAWRPAGLRACARRRRSRPAPPAVVHRVHRGHHGQQHLCGADVAGRLFPADVLFTGLQREPVGRPPVRVQGYPHQPAGQLPAQVVTGGDVRCVRAAVTHRHAEPLGAAHRDVGAHLAGRYQQGQGQQVGGDGRQRTLGVRGLDGRAEVTDLPAGPRVLQQDPEQLSLRLRRDELWRDRGDHELDPERLGPGGQHGQGLRQAVRVGQEDPAAPGPPPGQRHGLHGRGRLVQQGRPGHRQRGQVLDEGLEGEQRLEPPLRDLRLVRGVGRVPGRVLQDVTADDRRGVRAVIAQPDHGAGNGVPGGQTAQLGERFRLGQRGRQAQRPRVADPRGQGRLGQLAQRGVAGRREHPLLLIRGWPDVT